METSWPGTWLLVAFFTWVSVGVLGPLAWSMVYSRRATERHGDGIKAVLMLHPVLFEVGVLGACVMMAAIGYVGGQVVASGGAAAVSSEAIRTNIIPPLSSDPNSVLFDMPPVVEAMFIGLALLSQLLGYLGLYTIKKE